MGRSGPWLISVKTRVSGVPDYLPDYSCQGMFNSRIPVCCFLSLVSPLFLISSCHKWVEACRSQDWDQEMECMHGFPSLAFPYGERDYLRPSFDMDCLLTLWPVLLLVSSITCKVWSFDLYLKKLPCDTVCILTQSSINTLVPLETWVPVSFFLSLFFSLSLSLFLADSLEHGSLLSSFSCPGFQDLFERVPCAYMSGTSPVLGLYWFPA